MTMLTITPIYIAFNVLLFIVLAFRVVHVRIENQVLLGDGGLASLERAIRAHGNLAEYAPLALILLGLLEFNGLPGWQVHTLGLAFCVARVLHSIGVLSANLAPRSMGALLSLIVLMAMMGLALVQVIF